MLMHLIDNDDGNEKMKILVKENLCDLFSFYLKTYFGNPVFNS